MTARGCCPQNMQSQRQISAPHGLPAPGPSRVVGTASKGAGLGVVVVGSGGAEHMLPEWARTPGSCVVRCFVLNVHFGMGKRVVNTLTSRDRVPRKAAS